jgi:xanthine dehydrogenase accessory factor
MTRPTVVVRGGGELASAAARLLYLSGFPVLVLERAQPLAVRRRVAFADAVRSGQALVEGVCGRLVSPGTLALLPNCVTVAIDPDAAILPRLRPAVLVDARMLKRGSDTARTQAPLVVGIGPGLGAGRDVHAVIETQRGPDLGRVLWSGEAEPDTARPSEVLGFTEKRVVRAPRAGLFQPEVEIGDLVTPGQVLGHVDGAPVEASIAGLVRGLVADAVMVLEGMKIGDIDPRGIAVSPARISDKARAVAAGVLEAVVLGRQAGTIDRS